MDKWMGVFMTSGPAADHIEGGGVFALCFHHPMHAGEAAVELVHEGVERLDGVLDEETSAAPLQ
jgi:hypothetical protein